MKKLCKSARGMNQDTDSCCSVHRRHSTPMKWVLQHRSSPCCCAAQELQNSILDLGRRLAEAAEERATLLAVARQREAEVARTQQEAADAAEGAAEKARQLAATATQLKVRGQPPRTSNPLSRLLDAVELLQLLSSGSLSIWGLSVHVMQSLQGC